jgi:hypothetical protein
MYGTPMPVTFILLDTLEYNTIRVPTQFVNNTIYYIIINRCGGMLTARRTRTRTRTRSLPHRRGNQSNRYVPRAILALLFLSETACLSLLFSAACFSPILYPLANNVPPLLCLPGRFALQRGLMDSHVFKLYEMKI